MRIAHSRLAALAIALGCVALTSTPAAADLFTFTDRGSFNAAAGSTALESFEGLAPTTRSADPIVTAAFTVNNDPGLSAILDGPAGGFGSSATDGTKYLLTYRENQPAGTLEFVFNQAINSFGFDLTDNFETDGAVTITLDAGEGVNPITVYSAPPQALLGDGNTMFFGLLQTTAFTRVRITSTGIDDAYSIDAVAFGRSVPEPSSLALLAAGAGGLVLGLRRKTTPIQPS